MTATLEKTSINADYALRIVAANLLLLPENTDDPEEMDEYPGGVLATLIKDEIAELEQRIVNHADDADVHLFVDEIGSFFVKATHASLFKTCGEAAAEIQEMVAELKRQLRAILDRK